MPRHIYQMLRKFLVLKLGPKISLGSFLNSTRINGNTFDNKGLDFYLKSFQAN